ncbi:MAG: hypothetical protein GX548_09765, partial [Lentisphaerae bacterium]|nr:hypothetical protein [Lentisphaerota bacterium]
EDEGGNALLVNGNMLPIRTILAKAEITSVLADGLLLSEPKPMEEQDEETDDETGDEHGGEK